MRVEIWTDIACPWCYVGRARFERALAGFEHRDGVEVLHRSFELNPDARNGSTPIIDAVAAQYGRTREQQVAREEHAAAEAGAEGLGFRIGGRVYGNTFDVHRLAHLAKERGVQQEFLDIAFRVNFADERSVYDRETQLDLAVEAGLDRAEADAVLADPDAYAGDVRADERLAAELGAGGVPFFVLDRKYGVTGLQSAEMLTRALEQAWDNHAAARP
ncbi:DsbA family oxidoreductase [Actinacidiphila glaucinigra]|uniref:Predicted dithiol-disulfide isomerase, DsbA family n=1 Tax=Actinacidiphila glaucinigra TaxID=235986 RepID=A0A239FTB2_9ACTN|nr:DsbA family oxidoreductase [Actinacidiphila glaucinigra]SNS59154.1 Predicted dithiol-disulfide isomerase, DsbA family [Actinacidiphila glaucinigra]